MKYTPPAGGAADDPYDDGDRSAGVEGSIVPAAAFEHPQRELVHLIAHSGQTPDSADLHQVRKAIETLIAAAIGGGDTAQFVTFSQARARLPIYPEIVSADNRINVSSPAAGTIRVPSGVTIRHRGIFDLTTDETDFPTSASKTYHVRWSPLGGLDMKDLADAGYNPSFVAEGSAGFDSTYDDMLIARVVTDPSNVPTITNLKNRNRLLWIGQGSKAVTRTATTIGGYGVQFDPLGLDWARTPEVMTTVSRQGYGTVLQYIPEEPNVLPPGGTYSDDSGTVACSLSRYSYTPAAAVDLNTIVPTQFAFVFNHGTVLIAE